MPYNTRVKQKRAYLDLGRRFDNSQASLSATGPLICFVLILAFVLLFRLITILHGVAARCVENDEFWYTAVNGNWPLFGSLFLVFFLLFAWNALLAVDNWKRSTGTKVVLIANAIALATTLYVFVPLHDRAYYEYHARNGYYSDIRFGLPWRQARSVISENPCTTMKRFAGRWQVVDRYVGRWGFDIPAVRIELTPWGTFTAYDYPASDTFSGNWRPPHRWRYAEDQRWHDGRIFAEHFDARWDFDLQQETLILTTPEQFSEVERSTVVLQRIDSK
ncbi:MAG: hypothetical protein AAFX56_16990 [Pseudomonadota bacterium]